MNFHVDLCLFILWCVQHGYLVRHTANKHGIVMGLPQGETLD